MTHPYVQDDLNDATVTATGFNHMRCMTHQYVRHDFFNTHTQKYAHARTHAQAHAHAHTHTHKHVERVCVTLRTLLHTHTFYIT